MEQETRRWFTRTRRRDEVRRQEEAWAEAGRKRADLELERFIRRYAALGGIILVVATLLIETSDLWLEDVFDRLTGRRTEAVLQVFGVPSAAGLSLTNGEAGALSACEATIHDSMGVEWRAPVTRRIEARETVTLRWSAFENQGTSIDPAIARLRPVVVSCLVERLRDRRAALFDPATPGWTRSDSHPHAVPAPRR